MKQRLQSIFFFLSAVLFALLFFKFSHLAEFTIQAKNYLIFYAYGFVSKLPGAGVPFPKLFALPVLVLTVTAILLGVYLAMGLFRAVRLAQFQRLLKLAHVNIAVIAAWIAAFYGYVYFIVPKVLNDAALEEPVLRWASYLPLAALLLVIAAASGLRKDIKKVRSVDRIR